MNRAIIYTVGDTHQIFLNLSDEEAELRWNRYRDGRARHEILYEEKMGWKPKRDVVEFEDELLIWGNAGKEIGDMATMLLAELGSLPPD